MNQTKNQKSFCDVMEQINLSPQNKTRIIENCRKQRHVNNKLFLHSGQIAAALFLMLFSAGSLTVYGAVSAYQSYMEQMSARELKERYDNIQQGTKEADSFSRTLSESERDRMNQLRTEYEQGLRFPSESMYCFDGNNASQPTDTSVLTYDYGNMIFYIPNQELTDEQLLQIIDVWEKGNYSLHVTNDQSTSGQPATDAKAEEDGLPISGMEQYRQEVPSTAKEQIKQSALATVQSVYGKDFSGMKSDITKYGEYNPKYMVSFEDADSKYTLIYTPESTPENLTVYSIRCFTHTEGSLPNASDSPSEKPIAIPKEASLMEEIQSLSLEAKKQLNDSFHITEQISTCEYGYPKEALTDAPSSLVLVLTSESGHRYRFTYDSQSFVLREMLTYEAGKYDDIDLMSPYDKHGILEK